MISSRNERNLTKCLLLDAGGVLVDDIMGDDWIRELSSHSNRSYAEVEQYYLSTLKDPLFRGHLSRDEFWKLMSDFLGCPQLERSGEQEAVSGLQPRLGLTAAVEWSKKVRVGLLSNHVRAWLDPILIESKLADYADFILISSETGIRKPSVAAFELAASEAGLDSSQILFVDNQQTNLETGLALGMQVKLARPDNKWIEDVGKWVSGSDS